MFARLTRLVPFAIAMTIIAAIVYFFVAWIHSPNKAKELLIRVSLVLNSAIVLFFALAAVYASSEANRVAAELAVSFLFVGALGVVITLICRAIFLKHNPKYRFKAVSAHIQDLPLHIRIMRFIRRILLMRH